jgi:hypothetical protein
MAEVIKSPLTDLTNVGGHVLPDEEQPWDVPTAYALLADTPLPPVLRGEDLER